MKKKNYIFQNKYNFVYLYIFSGTHIRPLDCGISSCIQFGVMCIFKNMKKILTPTNL